MNWKTWRILAALALALLLAAHFAEPALADDSLLDFFGANWGF